jgi:hypothetical protein
MPVSTSSDDLQPPEGQASGTGSGGGQSRVQVFEARLDERGAWRLDEQPAASGWVVAIKQCLLVAVSLALAAVLWIFAFALMLVLLPLAVLAGWWMWRRLQALQRVARSMRGGAGPS